MSAVVVLASVSCSSSSSPAAVIDVDGLADRAGDAVWGVEAVGCGWQAHGSAFAIDSRHVVTNRHVIANDSSPIIRSRDGEERAGRVIGASTFPDVAVIEVAEDLPSSLRWTGASSLARREPLVVIGYPSPTHTFRSSTGHIVNFQGPDATPEAALVNAPIARGSSGGPGLRGDASVAGVVTQMTLRDKPAERVAILFTADAVRPTVTRFLRKPTKVLSSCGLGPDYVPPVPKTYEIEKAPPTAEPVEALPVPSVAAGREPGTVPAPRAAPARTSAAVKPRPCPTGAAAVRIDELASSQQEGQPSWWRVDVRGVLRNGTTATIEIGAIDVTVPGDPSITRPASQYMVSLAPGQQTGWLFEDHYVHSPGNQPSRASVAVQVHWPERGDCVAGIVRDSGPDPTPTPVHAPAA